MKKTKSKHNDAVSIEDTALRLLAQREHTQHELRRKLLQRGYETTLISDVLEKLASEGWQNDMRFVALYITERANKGYGPLRIAQELQSRGVSIEVAENQLNACEIDWCAQLKQAHAKKFKQVFPEDFKEKAKQIRFLQYRGFNLDLIHDFFSE